MRSTILRGDGPTTRLLVFEEGDEFHETLTEFAKEQGIEGAWFTALGAFREAKLAWFDVETNEYVPIPVDEQAEVATLVGNVARHDGEVKVHAHAVLGRRDGSPVAGHVKEGHVRPTLELVLVEEPARFVRTMDPRYDLPLLDPSAS